MPTPSLPSTALSLLHTQLAEKMVSHHYSKEDAEPNSQEIVALCHEIIPALQGTPSDSERDTAYNIFSLLCNHDMFSLLHLWDHDQEIMDTALALYTALPPTLFEAHHVNNLVQYHSQASQPNTSRCRLICNLLCGPKEHWPPNEIETMYYTFIEMEEAMRNTNEHRGRPICSVKAFLHGLDELSKSAAKNRKTARDTLHQTVQGLLYDDGLKLYADIVPQLDGYTVIKQSIASHHTSVLENLNAMISDEQLEQWFPKSGKRVHRLAQSYPRLQAVIEKRQLHQSLSHLSTSAPPRRYKM